MISPPLWSCLPFPRCLGARPSKLHETDDNSNDKHDDKDGKYDDEEEDGDDNDDYDDNDATWAKASSIILI